MVIPHNAKKVFNGILFDVYQWKQKMFDNSIKTFEMLKRKSSATIIGIVDDKIIILNQEQPGRNRYYSFVGGCIEKGESPLDAAKRELLEETGYTSSDFKLIYESFGWSKLYFHEYIFVARNCKKISKPNFDSGEKGFIEIVSYDKFVEYLRKEDFIAPIKLKFKIYEDLLNKSQEFKEKIFSY